MMLETELDTSTLTDEQLAAAAPAEHKINLLPGLVFGASLGLAAEVAGRLAVLLVELLKEFYALPRPPGMDMLQGYAYPSGHATLATATYGFLAILLARDVQPPRTGPPARETRLDRDRGRGGRGRRARRA